MAVIADLEERVWRALYEVPDPEFPISLVDLGLVYGVEVDESDPAGASVTVAITLTATACPCVEFIKWDVRERLLAEPEPDPSRPEDAERVIFATTAPDVRANASDDVNCPTFASKDAAC